MDEKLCPFRKKARWLPNSTDTDAYAQCYGDFAPCLREKCQMWRVYSDGGVRPNVYAYCGLAGKP